jgi:hypothetical protein
MGTDFLRTGLTVLAVIYQLAAEITDRLLEPWDQLFGEHSRPLLLALLLLIVVTWRWVRHRKRNRILVRELEERGRELDTVSRDAGNLYKLLATLSYLQARQQVDPEAKRPLNGVGEHRGQVQAEIDKDWAGS